MIEITKNLFIGSDYDFISQVKGKPNWNVIHACKIPYHKQLLGYVGNAAPKNDPEYLIAIRENILYLNLVDANSPKYIPKKIIDTSIEFIDKSLQENKKCLVHCNKGESRSPSIGLLYLAYKHILPDTFEAAERNFRQIYPDYNPNNGIRSFIIIHWKDYIK